MIGAIIIWSGAIVDIPAGWLLCDGENGTPDLVDRFVIGAGDDFEVDDTGGELDHTHDAEGTGHEHNPRETISVAGSGPGLAWDAIDASNSVAVDITVDSTDLLPPFYALAYIMRIS